MPFGSVDSVRPLSTFPLRVTPGPRWATSRLVSACALRVALNVIEPGVVATDSAACWSVVIVPFFRSVRAITTLGAAVPMLLAAFSVTLRPTMLATALVPTEPADGSNAALLSVETICPVE